jgi:D-glycero-alpha-D-manno-heptose-7-phosphate kinase
MIITRSPLRISLGGGGTDLRSYYGSHEGFVISAAINKYVYITVHETFEEEIIAKYSKMEVARTPDEIKHPIIRQALKLLRIERPHLEITSMSDIPAGTGLGSSGSFTTALLRAMHVLQNNHVSRRDIAEQACHIEIDMLGEPIGKQDQYIAAFGGITCFTFHSDDTVDVEPIRLNTETLHNLEDNLLLFFTGFTRSASDILRDQHTKSQQNNREMLDNLHRIKEIGWETKIALEGGDLRKFADLMNTHWEHKKNRSGGMTNSRIDDYYHLARCNGALGGKLIGAGGGGFLMFYTEDKTRLRRKLYEIGLREVRIRFDFAGTAVLAQS